MVDTHDNKLLINTNVREYFRQTVSNAVANQNIDTSEETVYYVVNLLTDFTHSSSLYVDTPNGKTLQPLAELYAEAVEEPAKEVRNKALKRLGDIALFISGIFSDSLNRKIIDVDYYISMGGNAYGFLSDTFKYRKNNSIHRTVFGELSSKFMDFVDVLAEVSEQSNLTTSTDILRLYEIWLKTNSERARKKLEKLGINPVQNSASLKHH